MNFELVCFIIFLSPVIGILEGLNICTRQETYTTAVKISEQQPYQVREYTWCLNFPPRCYKYKIKFKTVYKTQNLVKTRTVEDCCKGYTKDVTETHCKPVCSKDCLHGTCAAPDECVRDWIWRTIL
ncbi:hypothetical protein WA026_010109 [Henosepilachna vigintioctopunctata]|uniref:EMI domain-containing protein n=1 Tax=Henosepilachna vigintioctopunctata TaxID=420089 RepID=A0AAW1UJJ5_9CUCU